MDKFYRLSTSLVSAFFATLISFYAMKLLITAEFEAPEKLETIFINLVKPLEMTELVVTPQIPTPPITPAEQPKPPKAINPEFEVTEFSEPFAEPEADLIGPGLSVGEGD